MQTPQAMIPQQSVKLPSPRIVVRPCVLGYTLLETPERPGWLRAWDELSLEPGRRNLHRQDGGGSLRRLGALNLFRHRFGILTDERLAKNHAIPPPGSIGIPEKPEAFLESRLHFPVQRLGAET